MRFVLRQRVRQGCILSATKLQLIAAFNFVRMLIDAHAQVQAYRLFQAFQMLRIAVGRKMDEVKENR